MPHSGLPPTILWLQVSEFHREVSSSLDRLGLPHSLEYITPCGLYSLDIVLTGRHICIEVHTLIRVVLSCCAAGISYQVHVPVTEAIDLIYSMCLLLMPSNIYFFGQVKVPPLAMLNSDSVPNTAQIRT